MTTIVTRVGKGSPLTWTEVDTNFTNLNSAKYESGNNATLGTIQGSTITATTAFSGALNGTVGATTPAAGTFTSLSDSGNLTFTGTGNRITGDFSNATVNSRVYFQTSTTNSNTQIGAIPNGTNQIAQLDVYGSSDGTNASRFSFRIDGASDASIRSAREGTGTYLPMTFYTSGSERIRIDTSGNVLIGLTSTSGKFEVATGSTTSITAALGGTFPAYTYRNGSGAWFHAGKHPSSDYFYIGSGATPTTNISMVVDSSGNVGIGTSSPTNFGSAFKMFAVQGTDFGVIQSISANGSTTLEMMGASGIGYVGTRTNHPLALRTNDTERMRIDTSGNVLVGATSAGSYVAGSAIGTTGYISRSGTAGSFGNNRFNIYWNGSAARLWIDTVDQGSISVSSDYRIKTDVQAQTLTAIDRIAQLKPVTYTYADNEALNWKADGVAREGFIAHELQEIIPSAVDGEKDAENQIQSLKLDALCSVMVKAIQELNAKVTALEAQLQGN